MAAFVTPKYSAHSFGVFPRFSIFVNFTRSIFRSLILLPLSGDHGHLGAQLLDSLTLALDESSGVSWTVLDTEGEADRARRLVREAAANPANLVILGPFGAAESRAAGDVAIEGGIPMLALTSEAGVELSGVEVFRMRVSPEFQARQASVQAFAQAGEPGG